MRITLVHSRLYEFVRAFFILAGVVCSMKSRSISNAGVVENTWFENLSHSL